MTRTAFLVFGAASLGLGFAGAFLPVLPTTPFVLLAAYCFSKSSPEWHRRLRDHRSFGRMVRDWEERGAIRPRAKVLATLMMAAVASWAWWGSPAPVVWKAVLLLVEAGVLVYIWSRPSA